jgi:two-component system OmpR family sensor kinase
MRLLVASLILVTFATLIGFGWALDVLFVKALPADEDADITAWSVVARQLSTTLDQGDISDAFVEQWPGSPPLELIPLQEFPLPAEMRNDFIDGEPLVLGSEDGLSVHYFLPAKNAVLILGPVPPQLEDTHWPMIFTAIFYVGVLLLLLFWITPLVKRLLSLEQSARQFGRGDLNARVSRKGVSYIGPIEREFNRMAGRIQSLVADNKLLSSAVSHELRTPIARLRFGVDALSDTRNPATREKYIQRISSDLNLMERLVNSLLSYAKLDNQLNDASRQPVDLQLLLEECLPQYRDERVSICYDSGWQTGSVAEPATDSKPPRYVVVGNADHLAMLVNNLLGNAVKYGNDEARVALQQTADTIVFSVADDGPGIAPHKRSEVLQPFQRLDGNRQEGYGLGLAIVARIAEAHDATVVVDTDASLGGAIVTVSFFV